MSTGEVKVLRDRRQSATPAAPSGIVSLGHYPLALVDVGKHIARNVIDAHRVPAETAAKAIASAKVGNGRAVAK